MALASPAGAVFLHEFGLSLTFHVTVLCSSAPNAGWVRPLYPGEIRKTSYLPTETRPIARGTAGSPARGEDFLGSLPSVGAFRTGPTLFRHVKGRISVGFGSRKAEDVEERCLSRGRPRLSRP